MNRRLSCRVTFSVHEKKRNANFFVLLLFNHYHHKALKLFVSRAHGLGRKEGRKKGKKGKNRKTGTMRVLQKGKGLKGNQTGVLHVFNRTRYACGNG